MEPNHNTTAPVATPIGIIAGAGDFPILLAQAARSYGHEVFGFGLRGFASDRLSSEVDRMWWVELGQYGRLIDLMHQEGVKSVAMVGRVPHTTVFQYRHFDMRALKLLGKTINRKADSLLSAITAELESEGFAVLDTTMFLKSLLPGAGMLTQRRELTDQERIDVDFGFPLARAVAGQDIGQTIIVKEQMVIAVEAAEGTDLCIERAGEVGGPGCVVVKVSKPAQDKRFDVPVIGCRTIEVMVGAGCSALAVSANETLILDREDVIALADQAGIAIIAV